ncbi:MAG: dUTP diphosphatase [Phycisphaeraceae bacterium]|nr:dUTP diphosphatase [Phycisphaerales bacterium]MCB9842209.1 dUTP diphosphatase [Phycisphaeraceae bacterium]
MNTPNEAAVACSPVVRFKVLRPGAAVPGYQSEHAAGMDLASGPEDGRAVTIPPGEIRLIPTGLAMALEPGFEGQVRPRSGLACKWGVTVPNAPGTIDADYRGEVKVGLINLGKNAFIVEPGMRIAQLVIAPVARARVVACDELDETERGVGGFGSTGV